MRRAMVGLMLLLTAGCAGSSPGAAPVPTSAAGEATATSSIPRWPPVSLLPDEFFPRLVECLNDRGYPVTLGPDYTLTGSGSAGGASDRALYKKAREECIREVDPSYAEDPPPFTEAQLESLYGYLQQVVACLAGLGYPQVEMPSFERFSTDLEGRFDPVGVLVEDFGVFPDDADIATCRQEGKPSWFVAP